MAMADFDDYSTAAKLQSKLMMAAKKSTEEKARRVAMLKRRFADTISKAETALVHDAQIRTKQQLSFTASSTGAFVQSESATKTKEACEKRADDAGVHNRTIDWKKRVRRTTKISIDEAKKGLEKGTDRKRQRVAKQVEVVRAEKVEKGIDRQMQREAARAKLDQIERTVNLEFMQDIEALDKFSRQQPTLLQKFGLFLKA